MSGEENERATLSETVQKKIMSVLDDLADSCLN